MYVFQCHVGGSKCDNAVQHEREDIFQKFDSNDLNILKFEKTLTKNKIKNTTIKTIKFDLWISIFFLF